MFWLKLARSKGRTVRELQSVMTSSEFAEELAYHQYHDPLPESWRQSAMIAAMAFNPHVDKAHRAKIEDLIPVIKQLKDTTEQDLHVSQQVISHLLKRKEKLKDAGG